MTVLRWLSSLLEVQDLWHNGEEAKKSVFVSFTMIATAVVRRTMNDPPYFLLAPDETFDLWSQTLLYFKSMRDELADGEFRSTPNQSNPKVYKRRSRVQSEQ